MAQSMDDKDEMNRQLESEMTKSYIGGLIDGSGSVTVAVKKDEDYSLGFTLQPRIKLIRKKPFSIQMVDDWTAKNGIFATVRQYDDRYEFIINRVRDIRKFCEEIGPYVQDRLDEFQLLLEEIIPMMENERHLSDKEGFVEVVEFIDELRETSISSGGSTKYTADYFKKKWDMN